ncbi:MAG: diguanylate cyclase [Gemmatimonadetes bacterium]|nr:MAG: diguanylate cyclase [Gemmatimonadota bacterium]
MLLHDKLIQTVVDTLGEDDKNVSKIIELIRASRDLQHRDPREVYSDVLKFLTHLEFEPEEAEMHWNTILQHHQEITQTLQRNVGLRVAMLDYFININKKIENPKIIEIAIFEETQRSALTDALTGLYNRRYFEEVLFREIHRAKRYDLNTSLLFLDVDNFKKYNDTYGHSVGDQLLTDVGELIRKSLREADIPVRYGGEEFAVILPETSGQEAVYVAERIRRAIAQHYEECNGDNPAWLEQVTVSIGIASFPIDAQFPGELVEKADLAMYRAKKDGKNRVCLFFQERRIFVRVDAIYPVSYQLMDNSHDRRTHSKNISGGGILFYTDQPLELDQNLRLQIDLTPQERVIQAEAKVVRVVQYDEKGTNPYEIGISFTRIDPSDRAALIKCVRDRTS